MSNQNYLQMAANQFMLIQVSIGRWDGEVKLPTSVVDKYAALTGSEIAPTNGGKKRALRSNVKVLGADNHEHLAAVIGAFAAIRTYCAENTLKFSDGEGQSRGMRLIAVTEVPDVLIKLGELKQNAEAALVKFETEYPRYVAEAKVKLSGLAKHIKYPSASEVRAKFYASVTPPQPLALVDLERYGSLPAGLAQQIADASTRQLERQLDTARTAAIDLLKDHLDVIVKQLTDGKRLSDSLIENARHHSKMLRNLVKGYDNDPRLIALTDLIDEKISAVGKVEMWKNNASLKEASLRAAKTAAKGLTQIKKATPAPQPAANKPAVTSTSKIAGSGLIADLI